MTRKYYTGNIRFSPTTIFVFGSNPEGRHGKGAALTALNHFGARRGIGRGLQGNSYALPTKDLRVKHNRGLKSIQKEVIIDSIKEMYATASKHPELDFCVAYRNLHEPSLNGYTGYQMIRMFIEAGPIPDNVIFSKEWIQSGMFD